MDDVIRVVKSNPGITTTKIVAILEKLGYQEKSCYGCIGSARRYGHIHVSNTVYTNRIEHTFI